MGEKKNIQALAYNGAAYGKLLQEDKTQWFNPHLMHGCWTIGNFNDVIIEDSVNEYCSKKRKKSSNLQKSVANNCV